jgi:hypothetical protein
VEHLLNQLKDPEFDPQYHQKFKKRRKRNVVSQNIEILHKEMHV